MGTWESNQNALREYANTLRGGIPSNYKNISNVALGSMINAAWARQAEIDAERKRQLEVQKQKDADAALERKLKLQEMQYKIDSLNDAREQAKLVRTLAPWQPSSGFDSETGESITRANIPLDPILQATANAGGFNLVGSNYDESKASDIEPTNIMKKAFEDSFKAISAESQDPDKYKAMLEKERQKAIDNILSPYEISYESRQMTPDIYKANKIYDRNIYNTDAKLVMNQNTNETKENVAGINAKGKTDAARINADAKMKSSETAAKAGIARELIKRNTKLEGIKLTQKEKEKLAKNKIDSNQFSEVGSRYLSIYKMFWDSRNENETPKDIRAKTLIELQKTYRYSKEIIDNMRKGFKVIQSSPIDPGKDIKNKTIDLLTK